MNNNLICKKEPIISKNKTIFDCGCKFEIPIYQRGYEWEEKHIEKLIDDILNNKDNNYYLGILVISKNKKNNYEIIDGQQRLTTLYLILKCLGKKVSALTFAYRKKSTQFLNEVDNIIDKLNRGKKITNKIDDSMYEKLIYIYNKLSENKVKDELNKKLSKTNIIITELDSNLDLNHYFEIMNIRGEQLLQSDIVKSRLMKYLNNKDRIIFSEIWEACSDINSYVQMNFKPEIRRKIFGNSWDCFKPKDYRQLRDYIGNIKEYQPAAYTIKKITNRKNNRFEFEIDNITEEPISIYNDNGESKRFSSIIEFKYFLLHVLKVFTNIHSKSEEVSLDEMIVENKTTSSFDKVFKHEFTKLDFDGKSEAVKEFIFIMLKSRFLFDNYMIKRKIKGDNDGDWSLKYIKKQTTKNSSSFQNRFNEDKTILMLQSLLRVTYTSSRQMHWITEVLIYLNKSYIDENIDEKSFSNFIQNFIRKEIQKLDFYKNKDYYQGLETHHILFNYLDFLLWKTKNEYKDSYSFEYRNSVEHFYPRHPDINNWDEINNKKQKLVDSFGNLCLVTTSLNSHFSNLQPSEKKYHCGQDSNKNTSLKLREMFKYINETEDNEEWRKEKWKIHQEEMLKLLIKDVDSYKEKN